MSTRDKLAAIYHEARYELGVDFHEPDSGYKDCERFADDAMYTDSFRALAGAEETLARIGPLYHDLAISDDATHPAVPWESCPDALCANARGVGDKAEAPHKLLFPPHPDGFYGSSALCSCGFFQWDAETAESVLAAQAMVTADWQTHVAGDKAEAPSDE